MTSIRSASACALLALAVVAAPRALRAQGFEGVITFASHEKEGSNNSFVMTQKGSKVRIDAVDPAGQGGGAYIYDETSGARTILMTKQKMYMTWPKPEQSTIDSISRMYKDSSKAKVDFQKTGRTESVAGVSCDVYHGYSIRDGKKEEGDVCLAKGVGFNIAPMLASSGGRAMGGSAEWQKFRELTQNDMRILKITRYVDGKPEVALEATKIDRHPVADAAFAPPSDYKEFVMPSMTKKP